MKYANKEDVKQAVWSVLNGYDGDYDDRSTYGVLCDAVEAIEKVPGSCTYATPQNGDCVYKEDTIASFKEELLPADDDYTEGFNAGIEKAIWIIEKWMPSFNVEKHVRAEWDLADRDDIPSGLILRCLNCGFEEHVNNVVWFNFCPNCGADMRGDKNE